MLEMQEDLERTVFLVGSENFLWELLVVGKTCWLQSEINEKYTH